MYKTTAIALLLFLAGLAPGAAAPVQGLSYSLQRLPRGLAHKGKVVAGAQWRDRNGQNVVLLTETGAFKSKAPRDAGEDEHDAEVYAYQYVRSGGGEWKLLWSLYDYVRECPFDLSARFLPGSLAITDLDGDGRAEATFLYKLSCRSDVSPASLKLILREGKDKYALRGTTRVKVSDTEHAGGERNVDPAFRRAPARFRAYALKRWDRFVEETSFD